MSEYVDSYFRRARVDSMNEHSHTSCWYVLYGGFHGLRIYRQTSSVTTSQPRVGTRHHPHRIHPLLELYPPLSTESRDALSNPHRATLGNRREWERPCTTLQHDLPQRSPGSDNQRSEYQMTFKKCYIFGMSTANIRTELFWLQGLQECLGSRRNLFTVVEEARVYMKDWFADQLVILLSSCF
jgi:hypothetical protein